MPEPERQTGVQEPAILMQTQQIIVQGVKLDMSEGTFYVYLIDSAALTSNLMRLTTWSVVGNFRTKGVLRYTS